MTRGLLLDLDGTVFVGDALIPGALKALEAIRSFGLPILFATNMTRQPRRVLLEKLAAMGLPLVAEDVYTAPIAGCAWLEEQGFRRVLSCFAPATLEDLPGFEFVDPRDATAAPPFGKPVDAVLIGDLGNQWSYSILNAAFRHVMAGAALVAIQRNLYWRDTDGLSLDAGPFIVALESAASVQATVVGKPSRAFFRGAAALLGFPLSEIAMVGDDITSDVGGAQEAGATGVLVQTGKFREGDLAGPVRPDAVLDSIASLPAWIRSRLT